MSKEIIRRVEEVLNKLKESEPSYWADANFHSVENIYASDSLIEYHNDIRKRRNKAFSSGEKILPKDDVEKVLFDMEDKLNIVIYINNSIKAFILAEKRNASLEELNTLGECIIASATSWVKEGDYYG